MWYLKVSSAFNAITRYAHLPYATALRRPCMLLYLLLHALAGCRPTLHLAKTHNRKRQLINNRSSCARNIFNRDLDTDIIDDREVGAHGIIKGT